MKIDAIDPAVRNQIADELKAVIEHLDTLYADNQDCILPIDCPHWILEQWELTTDDLVPNAIYDVMRDGDSKKPGLKQLRPDDDLFAKVSGAKPQAKAKKVKHNPPLSSLHKSNHELPEVKLGKFLKWVAAATIAIRRHKKVKLETISVGKLSAEEEKIFKSDNLPRSAEYPDLELEIEYKYDGILVALYYENGKLIQAGMCDQSGEAGEDITENVKYVDSIPQQLDIPVTCRITGEMICRKKDFEAIQKKLKAKGEKLYKNTRNYTGGSLRQFIDPSVTGERRLYFIGHGISGLKIKNPPYRTGLERAKWANQKLGIRFSRVSIFHPDVLATLEQIRQNLEYDVDGAVVSVADLTIQEEMGRYGDRPTGEPRGKEAWKFAEEEAYPVIKEVEWNTARTGIITPVAIFDGVELAGTTVQRATLNNLGFMIRKKIDKGAEVVVIKSGAIIPKVIGVRKPIEGDPVYPKKCPSCGELTTLKHTIGKVSPVDDMYAVYCTNPGCPAQSVDRYLHFCKILGIKGLGPSSFEAILGKYPKLALPDLFTLTYQQLELCGFSYREALLALGGIHFIDNPEAWDDDSLLIAIKKHPKKWTIPLARFFACLGVPSAGKTAGTDLASHFGTLQGIMDASEDELAKVEGVGQKTAAAIVAFFKTNRQEVLWLTKYLEPAAPKVGNLSGKTFCLTGAFPNGKDAVAKKIESLGGTVKGSVSKTLNFLVVGDNPGDKVDKADKYGVKKIDLKQLERMM